LWARYSQDLKVWGEVTHLYGLEKINKKILISINFDNDLVYYKYFELKYKGESRKSTRE
jgi:hypothetical protein